MAPLKPTADELALLADYRQVATARQAARDAAKATDQAQQAQADAETAADQAAADFTRNWGSLP